LACVEVDEIAEAKRQNEAQASVQEFDGISAPGLPADEIEFVISHSESDAANARRRTTSGSAGEGNGLGFLRQHKFKFLLAALLLALVALVLLGVLAGGVVAIAVSGSDESSDSKHDDSGSKTHQGCDQGALISPFESYHFTKHCDLLVFMHGAWYMLDKVDKVTPSTLKKASQAYCGSEYENWQTAIVYNLNGIMESIGKKMQNPSEVDCRLIDTSTSLPAKSSLSLRVSAVTSKYDTAINSWSSDGCDGYTTNAELRQAAAQNKVKLGSGSGSGSSTGGTGSGSGLGLGSGVGTGSLLTGTGSGTGSSHTHREKFTGGPRRHPEAG